MNRCFRSSSLMATALFNRLLIAGTGLVFVFAASLSAQDLVWAKRAGGPGSEESYAIAVDGAGNSYVTGRFQESATFGADEANETTLSGSHFEIYVAKYDASGALVWAKSAGGDGLDEGRGIAVDGAGNSYITGRFEGSATFGSGEENETTLSGTLDEIFVAKYDAAGALVWVKNVDGSGSDQGRSIAVDGAGHSCITGRFGGSATFGSGEDNETTLSGSGFEIFVAKYDAGGALVWAKSAGGADFDEGFGIAIDEAGHSYVTGYFSSAAVFGAGEANETTLPGSNSQMFVAKYDASGAFVWAKRAGGPIFASGKGIAVNGSGHSFVTGIFNSTATFGPGEANETTLSGIRNEIFVARYDANGELAWVKHAGGPDGDEGLGIAVDGSDHSYVTGLFSDLATFGPDEANETSLSGNYFEIFVAKYDPSGALVWARRAGGSDDDIGFGIASDGFGSSHVTGAFSRTATFGPGEANETTLSGSRSTIFVAKYQGIECPPPTITVAASTSLWPPNHKYETITVAQCVVSVEGGCGGSISASDVIITKVTSDEPEDANGGGDGNTANDIVIAGDCKSVQLRSERQGSGNGRVYTIHLSVNDGSGNTGTATCLVTVPKSQNGNPAIADGPAYTVNGSCGSSATKFADASSIESPNGVALPESYALEQNYPNPFNPATTISFALPEAGQVTLKIYSETGQLVRALVDGEMNVGRHEISWDGRNAAGAAVASGIYFYRLAAYRSNGEAVYAETKRMVLVQ